MLPSSEQWQVGGVATVRGYTEGLLIGDSGYAASAELDFPIPYTKGTWFENIKGVVFCDHGAAFPYRPDNAPITHNDFLTSVGFGSIINLTKYFTARINFGIPLTDRENTQGDVVFQFYTQVNLL